MKIAATDETLSQVLGRSFFQIPRFQRPYSWGEDEVGDWLNDTLASNADYFIGSMVCYTDSHMLQVVDGQQRLTTTTLFMAALRDHFLSIKDEKLARGVQGFIERQDRDFNNRFILETATSLPYLQLSIQAWPPERKNESVEPKSPEERLLQSAYKICFDRIADRMNNGVTTRMQVERRRRRQTEALKQLRDRALGLSLIYIELDNEEDAYTVFETLNFRGKDLTAADLVRSHVMKMIPATNATLDNTRDRWTKIEQQLSESKFNLELGEFLYTSWISRHGTAYKKNLYRVVKHEIRTETNAREYVLDLEVDVRLYRGLIEPHSIVWAAAARPMKKSLIAIQQLDVNQHLPLLLTAIRASRRRNTLSHQKVTRLVEAVENFYYLSTAIAGKRPPGGFGSTIASLAKDLERADSRQDRAEVIDKAIRRLRDQIPADRDIYSACLGLRFTRDQSTQRLVIRHILERLHLEADKTESTDYEKMSIEHIAPQSPGEMKLGRENINALGNLLLVPKKVNEKKLNNKGFQEKRIILAKYTISDDPIHSATVWNADAINRRTEWLANQVANRFYKFRH